MNKNKILVGGEPHPNLTPSTTGLGGNRRDRRAAASHKSVLAYKCQGCGREVLKMSKTRAERDPIVTAERVRGALEAHKRVTGCSGEQPNIAANLPDDAAGLEMICAGCGVIIWTVAISQAKSNPKGTQHEASRLLREHVAKTGCPGEHEKGQPKKKRRDARCVALQSGDTTFDHELLAVDGAKYLAWLESGSPEGDPFEQEKLHLLGCRCEVEEERLAAEAHEKALREAERPDHGVFKEMPT